MVKSAIILLAGISLAALAARTAFSLAQKKEESVVRQALSDPGENLWPVQIRQPEGPPKVWVPETNQPEGRLEISCSTCHAVTEPNPELNSAMELDEFHQGMTFAHGNLSCLSCHNRQDYDHLALANGRAVSFENVMQLCSQCHGTQARDYQNGSHGGMTGYWDLKKGPRFRNNCIDCHDPHAPAYPQVRPVFPPIDGIHPK